MFDQCDFPNKGTTECYAPENEVFVLHSMLNYQTVNHVQTKVMGYSPASYLFALHVITLNDLSLNTASKAGFMTDEKSAPV